MDWNIRLLIFDLDDTLLHSNINYSEIRFQISELFSTPLPEEILVKTPILELLQKLKHEDQNKFNEGYRRVNESERKATQTATVISGAEKLPLVLKKYNLNSAIYTNNSRETIKLYLSIPTFEFLNEFSILTRDDIDRPKPDPEGIISIINRYHDKQISKENTMYIGDSYIDAIAADKANVKFIWFNSRNIDPELFPSPPYATLTDWSDFETTLLGLC
ncbi:MAG: HAD family hydrolase [Candidatus Thorarchaeota archaeon]